MTHPHHEHGSGLDAIGHAETVLALGTAATVVAYLAAAGALRRRGDAWPWRWDTCFTAGGAALVVALLPLPGGEFTGHMIQHLLAGMVAPLLLVPARPFTLVLRTLRPGRPRRALLTLAHSPASWLLFPPLAALLDLGGLWVLYRTPLLAATHDRPLLHAAVHARMVAAGVLFTAAICQLDPVRHRWSPLTRGLTLLLAGAAHAVLAKTLYGTPPPGTAFRPDDLHTGAQLMYYAGDLVELALATVIAVHWYTATGRAHHRAVQSRVPPVPHP
ncbi:cytochrome c oxidase assembly protein [Actinomadura fibrosa]|uniref:Cytochrome c oxidase assembly protein n=1 Tax=Actinomadura fibrosa TaxID=111802 RepID=A0ABW2XJ69_9ACTN|nr:cytochrome c oxidase assembly protein [Actinomadura fibrosa]